MVVERKNFIYFFLVLALLSFVVYGINYQPENKEVFRFCSYIILVLDLWMAIRNRHNVILFFIYIVMIYFNYSFLYGLYIFERPILPAFYIRFSNDVILGKGIYMVTLFTVILFIIDIITKGNKEAIEDAFFLKEEKQNIVISWILLIITFVSSLIWWMVYEYAGALVILAILYSGKNKAFKFACTLYIVLSFLWLNMHGQRIPGLCFPIIGMFMLYSSRINFKHIVAGVIVGILAMTYSGMVNDTHGEATMRDAVTKLSEGGGVLDTCQFSYMSSEIGIKVADDILTDSERQEYLKQFLKSQVLPNSRNVDNCKMCKITKHYYKHYDGQFMPHTWYFYLGWFGAVFSGFFVGIYLIVIKKLNINSGNLAIITSMWTVSMIGRWYLYEPNALIKGYIFLLIMYAVCNFIIKVVNKNRNDAANTVTTNGSVCNEN